MKFSFRGFLLVLTVGLVYVVWAILGSLLPPFYPREAEARGASPSEYGFVFGIWDLAAFISAPLFGRFGGRIGPMFLFCVGSFIIGLTSVAFGFLAFTNELTIFLGFSYLFRFIGGVAEAAAWGSILSILVSIFPGKESLVFGGTEMVSGFGAVIGPAVGSFLYNLGGFVLPFMIVGLLIMVSSIGTILLMPKIQKDEKIEEKSVCGKRLTFTELLKQLSLILPFIDNFVCVFTTSMVKGMLEPYFRNVTNAFLYEVSQNSTTNQYNVQPSHFSFSDETSKFDLFVNSTILNDILFTDVLPDNSSQNATIHTSFSQNDVAVLFCIQGAIYMITNLFIGITASHIQHPALVSLIGNTVLALALILLGPSPFLPLKPSRSLIGGSLALVGFCSALLMVASFLRANRTAINEGFQDDINTYIFISGMWSSSYFLGSFLGPTLGGVLVEHLGFPWTTSCYLAIVLVMAICNFWELLHTYGHRKYIQLK